MYQGLLNKIDPTRKDDRELVKRAFLFAEKAHAGQFRASGEPYITHPLATAEMLADLKLDGVTIAACLVHDVLEDTPVTEEEMEKAFGKEITFLVKAVTKLSALAYQGAPDIQAKQNLKAQSLRKMFFAMAEDIRVILIKLADRYHNMKTIGGQSSAGRQRISLETLEIYAPIAERLGMGQVKGELEDMAFPHVYPREYAWLINEVKDKYHDRRKYLERVQPIIINCLAEHNIPVINANARAKHYYSLYKKIIKQDYDLSRIYDLVALRIILPSIASCYEALGIVHKNYKPVPGLIKDYIALPKLNGYRSIHTTIFCEGGKIAEIQLRTPEMHEHAENGVAAHWSYGESGKNKLHTANLKEAKWIAELKNWMANATSQEFYHSLRTNFFSDRIFVLTPKGDVKDLPEGSTPLDFAYAIHTDIGHSAKAAKVNGKIVPLDYRLRNGEVIEIVTWKYRQPSRDWLNIVKTTEAKKKIQALLKEKHPEPVPPPSPIHVEPQPAPLRLTSVSAGKIFVTGQYNVLSTVAHCCSPLPSNEIIGYITKQRGISIHRVECANLKKFNSKKLVPVAWPEKADYYPLRVALQVKDRIGMLQEIGKIMNDLKINVMEIKNSPAANGVGAVNLTLALKNSAHAKRLFQKLESHKDILSAKKLA
ncbi:MAG: RelA/SpoT family protein [bacterium]|nr:RelA/SpoT family protein [bacterium]